MGRRQLFDAESAVRAARNLFWDKGFEAASLADIEEATGLNRSSLYRTFGSKRGLYDAAVDDYLGTVIRPRLDAMTQSKDARTGLLDYFEALTTFIAGQSASSVETPGISTRGCLLLDSAAGVAAHDVDQRRVVASYRAELEGAFALALGRAIPDAAGDVIARKARQLLAITVSALLLARVDSAEAVALLGAADEVIW